MICATIIKSSFSPEDWYDIIRAFGESEDSAAAIRKALANELQPLRNFFLGRRVCSESQVAPLNQKPRQNRMSLPKITLRIKEEPKQFLLRMDSILKEEVKSGKAKTTVKSELDLHSDLHPMTVEFSRDLHETHEGLVGMFESCPKETAIIRIAAIASQWKPQLSYEVYVNAIRELFAKPIKLYNKLYKRRYRLRIPKQESCLPCLVPRLKDQFEKFAFSANKRCLHPYDWNRFYQFVFDSCRYQSSLTEEDMRYHLRKAGFNKEQSSYIANVFRHCKEYQDWYRPRSSKRR